MNDSSERVTVTDDAVEVERTTENRPTATVLVYRLEAVEAKPVVVRLEETIPPQNSIEKLEFHPSHLPSDWTVTEGTVQFDATVPADGTRTIVLGIDAHEDERVGGEEPVISQPDMEIPEPLEADDTAPSTRGEKTASQDDDGSTDRAFTETVADGGEAPTDEDSEEVLDLADPNGGESYTGAESSSQPPASEDEVSDPSEDGGAALGGADDATERADTDGRTDDLGLSEVDAALDAADGATPEDSTMVGDGELEGAAGTADADAALETDATIDEAEPSTASDLGGEDDDIGGDSESETGGDTVAAAERDSLVGELVTEIQSGNVDEGELDALRSELGVARADEVRFRHVQSRMDDFEAYVEALEGIINTHGTASEFVDSIERRVSDLHDDLGAVRDEVRAVEAGLERADGEREQLREEVSELDNTVAGITEDLGTLRETVETVDDRTATLDAELREELADVREERAEQVDRLESELEAVREQLEAEFETELDSLREDVESFNRVRRSLLDAFGDGLEPAPDDDS